MIFCFSGTGNSRYIAQRIAEALQKTVIDLNARIKDNDTTTVDTGSDVVMVTPTYAFQKLFRNGWRKQNGQVRSVSGL